MHLCFALYPRYKLRVISFVKLSNTADGSIEWQVACRFHVGEETAGPIADKKSIMLQAWDDCRTI